MSNHSVPWQMSEIRHSHPRNCIIANSHRSLQPKLALISVSSHQFRSLEVEVELVARLALSRLRNFGNDFTFSSSRSATTGLSVRDHSRGNEVRNGEQSDVRSVTFS